MACLKLKILIKVFLRLTFRRKSGGVPMDENVWNLQNYSWNVGSINKISLESFLYLQVSNLKYLPSHKLQFLKPTITYWPKCTWKKSALSIISTSWNGINWNKHWGYPLTDEVDFWRHQIDYMSLSQNLFWYINYILVTWSK